LLRDSIIEDPPGGDAKDGVDAPEKIKKKLPIQADFFFGHSTSPGKSSNVFVLKVSLVTLVFV